MSDPKLFEAADASLQEPRQAQCPFYKVLTYYETHNGYLYVKGEKDKSKHLQACAVDAVVTGWGFDNMEHLINFLQNHQ